MIIKNGKVYQEDKTFVKKDLYIENGKIVESADEVSDKSEVDAEGCPGWLTYTATALWDMIFPTVIWRG